MDANNPLQKYHGWLVSFSGLGINLALGILYTWSLFKDAIAKDFGWQGSQLNDPYALCCLVFAFAMILAGSFLRGGAALALLIKPAIKAAETKR